MPLTWPNSPTSTLNQRYQEHTLDGTLARSIGAVA